MKFTFECVVEADLALEETIYSGPSAASALSNLNRVQKLVRLFELDAQVKIYRYRSNKRKRSLLMVRAYRAGEMAAGKDHISIEKWYQDSLETESSLTQPR